VDTHAIFKADDVGKSIVITGCTYPGNNGAFVITAYNSPTSISFTNASGVTETSAFSYQITLAGLTDNGGYRLIHFKSYTNVATANYAGANIYSESNKLDLFLDSDPNPPTLTATNYNVEPAYPNGTETASSMLAGSLTAPNILTVSSTPPFSAGSVGKLITLSGCSHSGNNGTYQILTYNTGSAGQEVTIIPSLPTLPSLPTYPDPTVTVVIMGAVVVECSGVKHYAADNGFTIYAATPGLWTNSYLTGTVTSADYVSAAYLCANTPYSVDLADFGAATRNVPYNELGTAFKLAKGFGPLPGAPASYEGVFLSAASVASAQALGLHTVRSPFGFRTSHGDDTGRKILVNTYAQTPTGRFQIEDFKTELFRYNINPLDIAEFALPTGVNYPILPYADGKEIGNNLTVIDVGGILRLESKVSSFDAGDKGHFIALTESANDNDGIYLITLVISATQVTVSPALTSPESSTFNGVIPKYTTDASIVVDLNGLQVLGGALVYPQLNHLTGSFPEVSQPIYTGVTGTRWFTRLFDTVAPANIGKFRIVGVDYNAMIAGDYSSNIEADHGGGVIIQIKVPGVSGWLDLGRADGYPSADKSLDQVGCLVSAVGSGTDWTYTYNTGFYTQNNLDGYYPVALRIGFTDTVLGKAKSISLVEWSAF
jgi:hypothetical protein